MKLTPTYSATFRTRLSPIETQRQLAELTEPENLFRGTGIFWDPKTKPYEGKVERHSFKVTPTSKHRNSFLPVTFGEITPEAKGTLVRVRMRVHLMVFAVIGFWTIGGLAGVLILFSADASEIGIAPLIPMLMVLAAYTGISLAFRYFARKHVRKMAAIWDAAVEEEG